MILVINTGSSSIKIALLEQASFNLLAEGFAQKLGDDSAELSWKFSDETITLKVAQGSRSADVYQTAMALMLDELFAHVAHQHIKAVGHRIVHGGEQFVAPIRIDEDVVQGIQALSHLAPLHNPANILGIQATRSYLPDVPHVAVFDTAFHHFMPDKAKLYAVPYEWYARYGVRKYGFHGTSHHYVGLEAAKLLERAFASCRLITVHLGNGCSATAIAGGVSVDTTMGLTPLEGLVMGTRCGDIDPSLIAFMAKQTQQSLDELMIILNKKSGLLGLSGFSNDMRALLQASDEGHEQASLAIEVFCYRLAKSIAGLAVALGQVDAIVFTGGIGEHSPQIREKVLAQLAILGITMDQTFNNKSGQSSAFRIHAADSNVEVMVIPTNEEKMIARYVCEAVGL